MMERNEAERQIAALRDEARALEDVEERVNDELIRLIRVRKAILTATRQLEAAIGEEPEPPPPPPPPPDDLPASLPGHLWRFPGDSFKPQGNWFIGPDAAPIRTLVVVAEWPRQPAGFAKLAGADAETSERGGFALGATPDGRTEAWADDGHAFAAARAPLAVRRPVLHVLRLHDQSIELYVDGHEREIGYGHTILPFTGRIVVEAGYWQHQIVDPAGTTVITAHAYDRPITDDELERIVDHFREIAPPQPGPVPGPPSPPRPAPDADITVMVAAEPDQTFRAGGFSIQREDVGNPWAQGSSDPAFERLAFTDLRANVVRWWYDYDDETFLRSYVHSGAMKAAQDHGVAYSLLGPIPFNAHGVSVPVNWGGSVATRIGLSESAERVAGLIRRVRDHGLIINATGLLNEPGSGFRTSVREEDWVYHIDVMRDALDSLGLKNVAIIGYEWQPPRQQAEHYARFIAKTAARHKIVGIASHSYGITINDELARIARENDWQYWMTEAGEAHSGADAAGRFLSDVNHRCTHWVFFMGPNTAVNHNTLLAPPNRLTPQYHALKTLWQAFVPGTVMHLCTSNAEGQMHWFRGGTRLNVAAGLRPDGKWAVGLVNNTGGQDAKWRDYPPAETIRAAVRLPVGGVRDFGFGGKTTDNGLLVVEIGPGDVMALVET